MSRGGAVRSSRPTRPARPSPPSRVSIVHSVRSLAGLVAHEHVERLRDRVLDVRRGGRREARRSDQEGRLVGARR